MTNQKVTVIVPIYNSEKYLDRCIQSIVAQTFNNLEIILINDGSRDNSKNICDEWQKRDDRIIVFHKQNGGVSSARNVGLYNATGELIYFCDSDDVLDHRLIEKLIVSMSDADADLAVCYYQTFTDELIKKEELSYSKVQIINQDETANEILTNTEISGYLWNKLFKRKLISDFYFDEKLKICEDEVFCFEYIRNIVRTVIIQEKLYYYMDNPQGAERQPLNINWLTYVLSKEFVFNQLSYYALDESVIKKVYQDMMYNAARLYLRLLTWSIADKVYWKNELKRVFSKYYNLRQYRKKMNVKQLIVWYGMYIATFL